jgi:hypothetical protein
MGPREQQVFVQVKSVKKHVPKGSHKGRQSAHKATKYSLQRGRTARNKFAAQQKHLAIHPNDVQAIAAINAAWDRKVLS